MSSNKLYDAIIVGASEEGLAFCEQLLQKTKDAKIAIISKHFNFQTTKHTLEGVDKFEDEAVFSCYKHRVLGVYMQKNDAIFGKTIIIATGTTPIKSNLKNINIKYDIKDIKASKTSPAVVYGDDENAAKYALFVAKKFKYVYLGTKSLDLPFGTKLNKKIENTLNILHLPNCNIVACKNDKAGNLAEVQLDTYSTIKCNTLVMSLGRKPANIGIDKRMVKVDSEGYIVTKEFSETTETPNIFAIGGCAKNGSKRKVTEAVNLIINRLKLEKVEEEHNA